jgi:hypothetical protein
MPGRLRIAPPSHPKSDPQQSNLSGGQNPALLPALPSLPTPPPDLRKPIDDLTAITKEIRVEMDEMAARVADCETRANSLEQLMAENRDRQVEIQQMAQSMFPGAPKIPHPDDVDF